MRTIKYLALSFLLLTSVSEATSITFAVAPTSRSIGLEDGSAIAVSTGGSYVIGTFTSASAASLVSGASQGLTINDWVNNILSSGAGWEQFGRDTTSDLANSGVVSSVDFTILAGTARLGGTITDNNTGATKADFFSGKKIYVWAFNADTIGASTQMGIFEATSSTPSWIFPTNAGGVGDTVTLSTTSAGATLAAFGGVGSISGSQLRMESISAVPEPSKTILGLIGIGMSLFRRKREVI